MDCLGEPLGRALAMLTHSVLHTVETGERTTLWEKVSIGAGFVVGLFGTLLFGFMGRHALAAFPEVFEISFGNFARPPRRPLPLLR